MKIISIFRPGPDTIIVWIWHGDYYRMYSLSSKHHEFEESIPPVQVKQYANYEQFFFVMGKFNPQMYFLENPVEIDVFDKDTIVNLMTSRGIEVASY